MTFLSQLKDKLLGSKFPLVAVDISDSSIELLQLSGKTSKPEVYTAYRQEIEPGLIKQGLISDKVKLTEVLRHCLAQVKPRFSSTACMLSLPDQDTYFLSLKGKDPQSFPQQIYNKAQENLPVELSECFYDYFLINELEAFFVAANKKVILDYLEVFQAAGLSLETVDFETACLARSLVDQKTLSGGVFILDLGAQSSDLTFVEKNNFKDQVSLPVGGYAITQKLCEKINKDFLAAEKFKMAKGLADPKIKEIVAEVYQPVIAEILKMSVNYEAVVKKEDKKIILAGGASLMPEIINFFSSSLPGFDVKIGRVDLKVDFSKEHSVKNNIIYANALGLALRGLNNDSLAEGINLLKFINSNNN